ncbi:hypothetical protein PIROE2DRAFT_60033 [Piromyces sp. E2]|nr:hypothetical protein PIROE2DRAFT_60033 [Piromyces sp. E2]|eukprot:OUM65376.1 hypothetical protein PIROE2DRAFT_60033 [Piromyces sp. E2]
MLWGSAFPVIKLGYKELNIENNDIQNILIFAGTRFFFASCIIIFIESLWKKQWIVLPLKDFLSIFIIGIFNTFLQYLFFYIGLVNSSGAKASVLNSTVTFFTLALAHFLFREDQLTLKKIIGCIFGITGVIVVNLNIFKEKNNNTNNSINDDLSFSMIGDGMILLSSFCSALGTVLIKMKNSDNKNELFYSYKNWKVFNYPFQVYHWFLNSFQKMYHCLNDKIMKKDQFNTNDEDNENSCKTKQDKKLATNEKVYTDFNVLENETLNYPYNFDKIFDKSDSYDKDIEKTEYFSSLDYTKRKNPSLNEHTLRNSYHSSNPNSFIYNDYLYEDSNESGFEEIEISSLSNKKFHMNHETVNYLNGINGKESNEHNDSPNKNKDNSNDQIIDLYLNNNHDIIMLTGYQMLIGSLFLNINGFLWNILFSNSNDNHFMNDKKPFTSISLYGYLIIGYMIVMTAIAFSLWNILIKYNSVGFLSFFNFLIPIFGTLFSGLLLKESIFTFINLLSLILVSFGVIISSF